MISAIRLRFRGARPGSRGIMDQPGSAGPAASDLVISARAGGAAGGSWLVLAGEADFRACDDLAAALAGPVRAGGDIHLNVAALLFADVAVARLLGLTALSLPPCRRLVLHRASPGLRKLLQLCCPDVPRLEIAED